METAIGEKEGRAKKCVFYAKCAYIMIEMALFFKICCGRIFEKRFPVFFLAKILKVFGLSKIGQEVFLVLNYAKYA